MRATGGLADTVVDANPETLADGTANGFVFAEPTPQALWQTIERALALWPDRDAWLQADGDRDERRLVVGAQRPGVRRGFTRRSSEGSGPETLPPDSSEPSSRPPPGRERLKFGPRMFRAYHQRRPILLDRGVDCIT